MNVKARIALEKRIASKIVHAALAHDWSVSTNDGESWNINKSRKFPEIMASLFTTDEDGLYFFDDQGRRTGWVILIYGNEGYDVVSDYSTRIEAMMAPINDYADKFDV